MSPVIKIATGFLVLCALSVVSTSSLDRNHALEEGTVADCLPTQFPTECPTVLPFILAAPTKCPTKMPVVIPTECLTKVPIILAAPTECPIKKDKKEKPDNYKRRCQ